MKEEALWFRLFLEKRPHISLIDPETNKSMRALVGTLGGYRSAFAYFVWTKQGKPIPLKWDQELKGMFRGFKQQEASLRQCGTLRLTEGQNQLTVPLYEALGHHFWKEGLPEHAFTNSWLGTSCVVQWTWTDLRVQPWRGWVIVFLLNSETQKLLTGKKLCWNIFTAIQTNLMYCMQIICVKFSQ